MVYRGVGVCGSVAFGEAFIYEEYKYTFQNKKIEKNKVADCMRLLEKALYMSLAELDEIKNTKNENISQIIEAHKEIISDDSIIDEIKFLIFDEFCSAEDSVYTVYSRYIAELKALQDPIFSQRAFDMEDVMQRIIRCLNGDKESKKSSIPRNCILVAKQLNPSALLSIDVNKLVGIVCEEGTSSSHISIIATSMGICTVVGIMDGKFFDDIYNGDLLIVDGVDGTVYHSYDRNIFEKELIKKNEYELINKKANDFLYEKIKLSDGTDIKIMLNIASSENITNEITKMVDGVGLFRTEFLFMQESMPSEEVQFSEYKKVVLTFKNKPVVLRILDMGADKKARCFNFPNEENPMLGNRGIRFCFSNEDVFKTQLRSALRASAYGNLQIMLPMITTLEDITQAKKIIEDIKKDLQKENIPFNKNIKIGIMIEVPSIAIMADIVAKEVDFASIGSNDLTQYILAADRQSSRYYEKYNPSVFRLIKYVINMFDNENKYISLCGELGSDIICSDILVGIGLRRFSVELYSVGKIKQKLTKLNKENAKDIAKKILEGARHNCD